MTLGSVRARHDKQLRTTGQIGADECFTSGPLPLWERSAQQRSKIALPTPQGLPVREIPSCIAISPCPAGLGSRADALRPLRIHLATGNRWRSAQGQNGHRRVDCLAVGQGHRNLHPRWRRLGAFPPGDQGCEQQGLRTQGREDQQDQDPLRRGRG
ncbi:hypothetical protein D9M71_564670 [compost metagenome]